MRPTINGRVNILFQRLLLILVLITTLLPTTSRAKDTILWQKVDWPPYQILKGEDADKGRFDLYIDLFQKQLPQYEHQNIEMNWSRFWKDVKAGKHVLNSMAIKTDERAKFALFSKVICIALPQRIIMKRSTLLKMGNPDSISLTDFIRTPNIHGILEQSRSYSSQLDEILNKDGIETNFERKAIDVKHIFKMISAGRADYTIEYPIVADYLLNKHQTENDSSLVSVRIEELPRYIKVHIAAPKTPWGVAVINNINEVIDDLKTTDRYLEIQKTYHSDPRELDEIQSIYEELFLDKRPTIVISGIAQTITHSIAQEVVQEAYKRIGYDVQFKMYPANRAISLANQGVTDGDIARIKGTEKTFPNLIPVPTPVIDFQGTAFTISVTKDIQKWSDLKGLKIGVVRGVRYATIGTEGLNPFFANNVPHLFKLLKDGRIDIAVAGTRQGQLEIEKSLNKSGIHSVGKPLFTAPLYHFIHSSNKDLVSPLNKALANMKAQGEINFIIDQTFQRLKNSE